MHSLTTLIQSLSGKEKSQFVKFSKQHLNERTPKILLLFCELNKVGKDKKKLDNVYKSFSPTICSKLYNQILKCHSLHMRKNSYVLVSNLITESHFLMDRGLFKQALKRLGKAKKIAENNHQHFQFLEISLLRRSILRRFKTKQLETELLGEYLQSKKRIDWIKEHFSLLEIYEKLFIKAQEHGFKKHSTDSDEIIIELPENIESFEGKNIFYSINILERKAASDILGTVENYHSLIQNFELHPSLMSDYFSRYIRICKNYFNACIHLGQYEKAERFIVELKEKKPSSPRDIAQLKLIVIRAEILLNLYTERYYIITQKADGIKATIRKYKNYIPSSIMMEVYNNVGAAFYYTGSFEKAIEWVNLAIQQMEIPHQIEKNNSKETATFSLIMIWSFRILILFEMKNFSVAKNLSTRLLLRIKEKGFEKTPINEILLTIRRIIQNPESKEKEMEQLAQKLKFVNGFEEFKHWLNVKPDTDSIAAE